VEAGKSKVKVLADSMSAFWLKDGTSQVEG
jgi:hypothetical protein